MLFEGYAEANTSPFSVASTVTYVRDGETQARIHDFWAIYQNDTWSMRPADRFELSRSG